MWAETQTVLLLKLVRFLNKCIQTYLYQFCWSLYSFGKNFIRKKVHNTVYLQLASSGSLSTKWFFYHLFSTSWQWYQYHMTCTAWSAHWLRTRWQQGLEHEAGKGRTRSLAWSWARSDGLYPWTLWGHRPSASSPVWPTLVMGLVVQRAGESRLPWRRRREEGCSRPTLRHMWEEEGCPEQGRFLPSSRYWYHCQLVENKW